MKKPLLALFTWGPANKKTAVMPIYVLRTPHDLSKTPANKWKPHLYAHCYKKIETSKTMASSKTVDFIAFCVILHFVWNSNCEIKPKEMPYIYSLGWAVAELWCGTGFGSRRCSCSALLKVPAEEHRLVLCSAHLRLQDDLKQCRDGNHREKFFDESLETLFSCWVTVAGFFIGYRFFKNHRA